jgi:hypothetical protein
VVHVCVGCGSGGCLVYVWGAWVWGVSGVCVWGVGVGVPAVCVWGVGLGVVWCMCVGCGCGGFLCEVIPVQLIESACRQLLCVGVSFVHLCTPLKINF